MPTAPVALSSTPVVPAAVQAAKAIARKKGSSHMPSQREYVVGRRSPAMKRWVQSLQAVRGGRLSGAERSALACFTQPLYDRNHD